MARDFRRYHRERCVTAPPASGYYNSFTTAQTPFQPSLRYIDPGLGVEVPAINCRAPVPEAPKPSLDQLLVTQKPSSWKPSIRYIDPGSGSRSERQFKPSRMKVQGPPDGRSDPWRSSIHTVEHIDESADKPKWKSSRHRPSIFSDWYLSDNVQEEWRSSKKPGIYTHQAEWIPPFRDYEGEAPKRFYTIPAGAAAARRKTMSGRRRSTVYNQFDTTFDKDTHYDYFKKPLGGIKCSYKNDHQWPFNPLPPPRCKKRFYTHIAHTEGVSTLLNHTKDYDYNAYIFL